MNSTVIISILTLQEEAYWCLKNYMRQVETEFMEEGVLRKLGTYSKYCSGGQGETVIK